MTDSIMGLSVKVLVRSDKKTTELYEEVKSALATVSPEFSEVALLYIVPEDSELEYSISIKSTWIE
jgi:hypothetical protein